MIFFFQECTVRFQPFIFWDFWGVFWGRPHHSIATQVLGVDQEAGLGRPKVDEFLV